MKKKLILLLISFILVSCGSNNNMEKKIDTIFVEFQNNLTPGASVAVIKNGEIIYQKGFGYGDLSSKIAIEPKSNFRLASITKQFTALSILLLEEEGKLSLEDKLIKFFPKFPAYGEKITIKNILQHTSGLLDYEDFVSDTDTAQVKDKDVLQILMKQDSTYFEPGAEHKYSNSGYAVLAMIVEKVSGIRFADFLYKRIFKPLKMDNTIAYEFGVADVSNRTYGYAKTQTGFEFSDQSLTSAVLGDGGIYSSTIDLINWDKEVNSPTLLPIEKFDRSFIKGVNNKGEEFDYGFGWRLDPYHDIYRIYHTGGTCGFSNIYMKLPTYNLTIIVLMNVRDYDAKGYAEKIADLFIDK